MVPIGALNARQNLRIFRNPSFSAPCDRRTEEFEIWAHTRRCQVPSTSADRIFTTYRLYNLFRYEEAVSSSKKRCEQNMPGHRRLLCAALIAAQTHCFVPAPPEVAALRLKETLDERGVVRVPGATFPRRGIQISPPPASRRCTRRFRALLRWKGAKEEDLQLIESGAVHADVATDEGAMAFRQSAAHRLVATGPAPFVPAQRPAVTKIPAKEVLARRPARQRRLHGSVARRSRPPPRPRSGPSGAATASGRSRRRPTRRRRSPSPSPRSSASSCPTRTRRSTA